MTVKLLTKHHLEFLSLKGGSTSLYESTLVKMAHCLKPHVTAEKKVKMTKSRQTQIKNPSKINPGKAKIPANDQ